MNISKSDYIRAESKEFAFTKLMTCGLCGSGITTQEKYKKLKNGETNRHIYYGCTKAKDKNCKAGFINEVDLIKQFEQMLDKISLDEIGMKKQIEDEVIRFKKFQRVVLGNSGKIEVGEIDIRNYAKFIIHDGLDQERRELLSCFRSRILLKDKIVTIS